MRRLQRHLLPPTLALAALGALVACGESPGNDAATPSAATLSADSLQELGFQKYDSCLFSASIEYNKQALELYEQSNDSLGISDCWCNMSLSYQRMGDVGMGIEASLNALRIDSALHDRPRMSSDYNNIAALYLTANDPHEARKFIDRAIAIELNLPGAPNLSIRYGIASEIYTKIGKSDRALELAQKAYALDRERGDTVQFARRLSQVGDVYASMRRYREAEESYHESIRWLRTKNSLNSICINHKQLGNLYRSQGRTREAIASYEQSATLARSIRNNYILQQCVERLSELYEMTDPARALRNLRESAELKDITYNERTNSLLSSYAIHFETSQKTSTILAQQEELRTRHMVNIVSVAFALLALVALVAIVCVIRLRTRNRRLEREMERTRQDFYTNIAHELRTPLTVILGQAQSLGDTEKSPAQRKRIQSIASQGQVLLNLVDQLLDISQIRPVLGNEAWRTGDIVPRVRMLVESFCVEAQQSLINVEFQPQHPSIVMDFIPEYLRKSLASLVSNAIKFTPRGGRIIITISQKSGSVVFAIADNGAGIPAEDMPHIFEAFYQGHAPKATLGTGIGLYIVRQMTQAMYGTVEVSSIEGRGSCFTLTLPQHQPGKVFAMLEDKDYQPVPKEAKPASGTPDDTPDDTDGSGATQPEGQGDTSILVVDDNTEVARYIGAIFSEDHQLIYASDGEEGLAKATEYLPDLIVTDLMMPQMNGAELCRRIRAGQATSHIPVVILSARSQDSDRVECMQAGADDFLVKPFNADVLRASVERLLDQRALLHEKYSKAMEEDDGKNMAAGDKASLDFVARLNQIISKNVTNTSLSSLLIAEHICLSQRQLNRKVKSVTGVDTATYIRNFRLQMAKRLLSGSDENITSVYLQCGFDNPSYFSRLFKQEVGCTPTDYRRRNAKS